jgi:hypothetical protein
VSDSAESKHTPRVRFDRNEFAGSFGDLGTEFPLIAGLILVADLDAASVLIMFGLVQIGTGLYYGIPMPAQPLKAMAAIVIAQGVDAEVLYGGGLAIGVVMLFLVATGLLGILARAVPKVVVRGIQFGLGLNLAMLALTEYVPADGEAGYALAGAAALITILLLGNRRVPPALLVIALGLGYAFVFRFDAEAFRGGLGFFTPETHVPQMADVLEGFLLLGLAQLPLSLGNSVLATDRLTRDLFPHKRVGIRKIGFTYSVMNLVNPFFGGIPTCHGAGGMVGHYAFGARTGGSVIIEGSLYLGLGLFAAAGFREAVELFPLPILGVILAFEGLGLMRLVEDVTASSTDLVIALLIGLVAAGVPYGYLIGLVAGTVLVRLGGLGLTRLGRS